MSNLIGDGMTWLAGQLKDNCAVPVTYSRVNASTTLTLSTYATLGRNPIATVGAASEAVLIDVSEMDFLIRVADLILDGSAVEPKRGDRIGVTLNGVARVFEVNYQGDDQPFSYDPHRTLYRIHTKQID